MITKLILILSLLAGSIALASEPLRWIAFHQDTNWDISINADGSAMMLYASGEKVISPPSSFNLERVEAALGRLVTTNPGLQKGVKVYSSLMTDREATDAYYSENIDYAKELVKEVFEKSWISAGDMERFQKWLEKEPPLGVQLYFDEKQIRREGYTGPPIRLRKPPPKRILPEWSTVTQCFPIVVEVSAVAGILFSTPWPYLALGCLFALGLRRYRLKKRAANTAAPEAL